MQVLILTEHHLFLEIFLIQLQMKNAIHKDTKIHVIKSWMVKSFKAKSWFFSTGETTVLFYILNRTWDFRNSSTETYKNLVMEIG